MPDPLELLTPRLRLRTWTEVDRNDLAQMMADPEVMHDYGGPINKIESDRKLDDYTTGFISDGCSRWLIESTVGSEPVFIGYAGVAAHIGAEHPLGPYAAIADADEHAAFTGAPATGSNTPGEAFTSHGGAIEGWTLAAELNRFIVHAWRPADWPAGVYSLVRYDFELKDDQTVLTLTHSSMPEGAAPHLEQGWNERYWPPLAKHLKN